MKILLLLITALLLSGCATERGVAVYGWKSNITISINGDAVQDAAIEATSDTNAEILP
jgi:predicted small secreted protein